MKRFLPLFLLLTIAPPATASDPTLNDDRILPVQRADSGHRVDGRLDEAAWLTAAPATDFVQFEPNEGQKPSQATEVRVLYTSDAIIIGARLFDSEPSEISATLGRRDDTNQADWFFASIDSYFDRKTAYTFGVNAAGVQFDGITTRDTDETWNAVWQSAVRIDSEGWTAEMRIPLTMLRFVSGADTWGINFRRDIPRTSETIEWAMVPRTERRSGYVARYGRLMGISGLDPARNVQILPYSVSRIDTYEGDVAGQRASSSDIDMGVDLKVGLTSNITLDATVNPDFGQVDADPAQLNLTAFETFFDEKRPFFVEGAQIMNFRLDFDGSLLYTRRIGAREPIIGASKITGRTDNGLSFGVLGASTGADYDPTRLFTLARARQELGRFSYVGGIVTATDRSEDEIRAYTGGLDWDIRMGGNRYAIDGFFSFSDRGGAGIGDNQRGVAGSFGFDRISGTVTWGSSFRFFSDTFNPNDLGRLRRNDFMRGSLFTSYQMNGGQPFGPFLRGSVRAFTWQSWSYAERINQGAGVNVSSNLVTRGFQRIDVRYEADNVLGGYDLYETRGLLPYARPAAHSVRLSFRTDSRKLWQVSPSFNLERDSEGGADFRTSLDGEWNVSSRLNLSAEIGASRSDNRTAWVSNEAFRRTAAGLEMGTIATDPSNLEEDEWMALPAGSAVTALALNEGDAVRASVFGSRDTRSMDVTLRSDVTFTPKLSVQFYGQLFGARGRYDGFQLQTGQDDLAAFDHHPKRHDFSLSRFQTNTVLRWEYRPGSTLYLVWSQSRGESLRLDPLDNLSASPYDVGSFSQLTDTFDFFPANAFLIKLNYIFLP
ncbi:MAG: carbohydrate binding family 9 domain-containing protein [Rhodothermales bacterium]|nr:carbohydrate binding family 9 domain-containing protein [Rhodothermales bacterium]MBO6780223.1 carbohydrate binding family 9 domain-containing protein [Rhodothermales bacterium]